MSFSQSAALAWQNMTHDPKRLAVSMAGIAFAVVLMGMELGFYFALLDSMVELVNKLKADLVIVSRSKSTLASQVPFNIRALDRARAVGGVRSAFPLYLEVRFSLLRNPLARSGRHLAAGATEGASARKIRVLAFDPDDEVFTLDAVKRRARDLNEPGTALYDDLSRAEFGPIAERTTTALARRPVRIVGAFPLGTDLVNDGNMIMSAQNFLRFFPDGRQREPDLRLAELGLVRLAPGADPIAVRDRLRAALRPMNVRVFTRAEYIAREQGFWRERTPVGAVFMLGAALGMVVGLVICYQILSSDIADHLAEYATLKAMGRGAWSLLGIVVIEAVILAALGFLPGIAVCRVLYGALARETGLLMTLTAWRALRIFGLTLLMCLGSSLIAIRKLLSADPAELF